MVKRNRVTGSDEKVIKLPINLTLLCLIGTAIRIETLGSAYLQVDEAKIRYLEPGHGQSKNGYLWLANNPLGSLYYHWGIIPRSSS